MFEVTYRGYTVLYNGSATFNVWLADGPLIDCFTAYPQNNGEAFQDILEWIDAHAEEDLG